MSITLVIPAYLAIPLAVIAAAFAALLTIAAAWAGDECVRKIWRRRAWIRRHADFFLA